MGVMRMNHWLSGAVSLFLTPLLMLFLMGPELFFSLLGLIVIAVCGAVTTLCSFYFITHVPRAWVKWGAGLVLFLIGFVGPVKLGLDAEPYVMITFGFSMLAGLGAWAAAAVQLVLAIVHKLFPAGAIPA